MTTRVTLTRRFLRSTALTTAALFIIPARAFADMGFKPGEFGGLSQAVGSTWPYAIMCIGVSAFSVWGLRRMVKRDPSSQGDED